MEEKEICKKIMEECLERFKNENINVSEIAGCLCGYLVAVVSEYYPDPENAEKWVNDMVKTLFELNRMAKA